MNPRKESEELLNSVMPFVKKMLSLHGEFFPCGGYMKTDGTIVEVGASDPDTDRPKSKDMIYVLRSSFQEMARNKQCKAAVIFFDVTIVLPESGKKSSAIQVYADHIDGYSADVFFPYQIVNNEVVYGQTLAQQAKSAIFGNVN